MIVTRKENTMKTITNSFAEGVIAMFCNVGRQYTFAKRTQPTP